jgi:hypothetical protein|tara:strand:+ start:457 stop:954 length:498 start_codon:yes stop_codon:yes gene_type:complete
MWTVLKFDRKKFSLLKEDFEKRLGEELILYTPKLRVQKFSKNKLINKDLNLLGDYLFCFHKNLKETGVINSLKFTRGLKYFLNGYIDSQKDIENFVTKCKEAENKEGFLSRDFFDVELNGLYKFNSGPFTDKIFKIINLQKNRFKVLIGNIKTTIKKKEFLFTPI